MFFKKEMYKYNEFDRVKINLSKLPNSKDKLNKICENGEYYFYEYTPDDILHYSYVLAQSKQNLKKVFMLGKAFDFICEFKNSLFLCNKGGEINRDGTFIHRLDLNNNTKENYNLRWKYSEMIVINGYGRFHVTDKYLNMNVINNELIIDVHRTKSLDKKFEDDEENCNMDYQIVFKYENGCFIPYFRIDKEDYMLTKN